MNNCGISTNRRNIQVINTSSVGEFRSNPRYNDHNVGILCAASSKNGDFERIRRKGDTNSASFARKGTSISLPQADFVNYNQSMICRSPSYRVCWTRHRCIYYSKMACDSTYLCTRLPA